MGFATGVIVLVEESVALVAETVGLVAETVVLIVATAVLLEGMVDREVGVEGLDDFEAVVNVGRPVGVAGLEPGPPDDEGLRIPPLEELKDVGCLDTKLLLPAGSV